jgi:hypothetical protein
MGHAPRHFAERAQTLGFQLALARRDECRGQLA